MIIPSYILLALQTVLPASTAAKVALPFRRVTREYMIVFPSEGQETTFFKNIRTVG